MAVQIVVADTDSHPRLFLPLITQGYATLYALLFESSVVLIDEQEAGGRVARNIYVGPAVLVEVRGHDSHSIAGPGLPNARLHADVGKGSISIIPVKGVAAEGKASGTAGDGKTLPIAVDVGSWPGNVLEVELHVIGDAQIQVTIPVVIKKRAPSAPSDFGGFQASFFRDIFEPTVSEVTVEAILAVVGAKQILIAVIVVIANTHGVAPANCFKPRLPGYVGKCPVTIILIKPIGCSGGSAT
jgi:hypothetical protein